MNFLNEFFTKREARKVANLLLITELKAEANRQKYWNRLEACKSVRGKNANRRKALAWYKTYKQAGFYRRKLEAIYASEG